MAVFPLNNSSKDIVSYWNVNNLLPEKAIYLIMAYFWDIQFGYTQYYQLRSNTMYEGIQFIYY
jgi:hypothetical protein